MLRSIEEVAIQLGVSKTSIYNKLKLKIYKGMVVKKQGKSMVDEELFNLIKDSFQVENEVENRKNANSVKQEIAMDREGIFNLNKRLNIELLEQLKEKDKQITELQKLLDHSQRLIENNHVLLKQQQDKEINQLKLEEHFKEVDEKLLDLRNKMENKVNEKLESVRSFWKFNKLEKGLFWTFIIAFLIYFLNQTLNVFDIKISSLILKIVYIIPFIFFIVFERYICKKINYKKFN